MLKFVYNFNRSFLNSTMIFRKFPRAHASSYQFRVERPFYYPNRANERQRAENRQAALQIRNDETMNDSSTTMSTYRRDLRESCQLAARGGLRKQSTMEQIKSAYYNLAKMFHRDAERSTYETQRFKEISSVYKSLIDECSRIEHHDRDREESFLRSVDDLSKSIVMAKSAIKKPKSINASGSTHQKSNSILDPNNAAILSTEELLKLASTEPKIELTFEEAAQGVKRNYALRFVKKCSSCHGKSPLLANRSNPEICRKCCGTGTITKHTATYSSTETCDRCNGSKFIKRNQCSMCDNRGLVMDNTIIPLTLPAGIKTGETVTAENPVTKKRVSFCVQVHDSKYFRRFGNDVHTEKYVSVPDAILGCSCTVRGLYGKETFKVPPGFDSHSQIVIPGKGIKSSDGTIVGDHVVTVKVAIPKGLNTRQRQLILALSQTEDQPIEYND